MSGFFKTVSEFFTIKKKKIYNTELNHEQSEDNGGIRKESFKTLDPFGVDEMENKRISEIISKDSPRLEEFIFISPIPEERFNDVIEYLKAHYINEPLLEFLGLWHENDSHTRLEAHCLETLQNHLSVMAMDKDHKVSAVSLNAIKEPGDKERRKEDLRNMSNESFKRKFRPVENFNDSVDIFFKYNVEKIFTMDIFSVDKKYQEIGLGEEIVQRTERLARKNNFQIMKTEAAEPHILDMLLSLDWELVEELKYENEVDENEEQISKPTPTINSIKVMIKNLQEHPI